MSVHQKPDGRHYCTWYEGRQKRFKYFGRTDSDRILAERYDEQIKRDKGKVPQIPGGLAVAELLQRYHSDRPVESTTSQSDYYRITSIMIPLIGAVHCDALTSVELNRYVKIRLEAGRKLRTISREIDILRAAMNWAESSGPAACVS